MGDLTALSATQAARLIAQGGLKPSDLLRAYLARIDSREHEIKAFEHITSESALAHARQQDQQTAKGLLFGIPIGVKDLIDTKGMTTTYGSAIYRNHIPQADAACVTQARRQGAIVLGKTVTTEFAVFHPGKTANPHDTGRTPGGSSSGSAAAVASRMVHWPLARRRPPRSIGPHRFAEWLALSPPTERLPKQAPSRLPTLWTRSVFWPIPCRMPRFSPLLWPAGQTY